MIKDDFWEDVDGEPGWNPDFIYRVKPKTVPHYMVMFKNMSGAVSSLVYGDKDVLIEHMKDCVIIGDIETREVEV